MAKSRIKSEEEYNKILGVTPVNSDEKPKTTHDASQYFDELKDSKREYNDADSNPFDRVISVEQIKENLKHSGANNVENIKAQIASAQKEVLVEDSEVPDETESYVRATKHSTSSDAKKEFSFEENARKLYENLRGSNLSITTKRTVDEEPRKINEIDVVEPISISKERVTSSEPLVETPSIAPTNIENTNTIPATSSLEANFDSLKNESEPVDRLELTADFTLENENFIEAINQRKKDRAKLPVEPTFEPQPTPSVVSDTVEPIISTPSAVDDSIDLVKQLDEQMGILEDTGSIDDVIQPIQSTPPVQPPQPEPIVNEQVPNNSGISDELDMLTRSKPKDDLSSTLTLALDPENSISFSPDDMKTLKSEELLTDKEKPKSKIGDIIVTLALIIMICIVIFLLVKMLILDK